MLITCAYVVYIKLLLPHLFNIKHIEVISAQLYELNFTTFGPQMMETETIVHYQKCKALIPTALCHKLLTSSLSLCLYK